MKLRWIAVLVSNTWSEIVDGIVFRYPPCCIARFVLEQVVVRIKTRCETMFTQVATKRGSTGNKGGKNPGGIYVPCNIFHYPSESRGRTSNEYDATLCEQPHPEGFGPCIWDYRHTHAMHASGQRLKGYGDYEGYTYIIEHEWPNKRKSMSL